jgi:hypothetical protein
MRKIIELFQRGLRGGTEEYEALVTERENASVLLKKIHGLVTAVRCGVAEQSILEEVVRTLERLDFAVKGKNASSRDEDVFFSFRPLPRRRALSEAVLLRMLTDGACTVAHVAAAKGRLLPEEMSFRVLAAIDREGETVAHVLARNGFLPYRMMTEQVLLLRNGSGRSVAHELAETGRLPVRFRSDEKILGLVDNNGVSVKDLQESQRFRDAQMRMEAYSR